MYIKKEADWDCVGCWAYSCTRGRKSMDAYNDYPEEVDCKLDWSCSHIDCDGDCPDCEVRFSCGDYNND
jgi:hypothetical protein